MDKLLILTSSLSTGGITSFAICLANELSLRCDVTLAYSDADPDKLKEFNSGIRLVQYAKQPLTRIAKQMLIHGWLPSLLKIKFRDHASVSPMDAISRMNYASAEILEWPEELQETYDLAISASEFFCNDVLALKVNAKKKAGWIHPDYKALHSDVQFDRRTLDQLDYVVTVSEQNRKRFLELVPDYGEKVLYIPNLLDKEKLLKKSKVMPEEFAECESEHRIVSVCRLDNSSKRLDRAINIARELKLKGDSFRWFVIGDGPDRTYLQNKIAEADVEDCFLLIGERKNPYPYMAYADLMVLTSQYEGKPITVDEALVLKCPVFVTEYAAAHEQVPDKYGIVIANSDSLYLEDAKHKLVWDNIEIIKENLRHYDHFSKIYNEFGSGISCLFES